MKKKFDIKGMTCASCQAHVFNAVSKLDGASNVNVNLLKNTLELDCDESKLNDNDIIKSAKFRHDLLLAFSVFKIASSFAPVILLCHIICLSQQ